MKLLCDLPPKPAREHDEQLSLISFAADRQRLILRSRSRWINGSKIRWAMKGGSAADRAVVIQAVAEWQLVAQGLVLEQVDSWSDADVRIQFVAGGSWSYVGTDCLHIPRHEATMQFGWSLTDAWGRNTAKHEWGHALGFPHEHQNPRAGIRWNERAVIDEFSGSPNFWTEEQIRHNILNKIPIGEVTGSNWDPDSVMHYPFEAGLILEPAVYRTEHLIPALGLSEQDIATTKDFYPALTPPEPEEPTDPDEPEDPPEPPAIVYLERGEPINLGFADSGDEMHFMFDSDPGECISVETLGSSDTILVLKDDRGTSVKADDDSGLDRNAKVTKWSRRAQRYYVALRIVWKSQAGDSQILRR